LADDDIAPEEDLGVMFDSLLGDDPFAHDLLRASRVPRVRPILVVLAARAAGASAVDKELHYAAELLYGALTVHDVALGGRGRRRRIARRVLRRSMGWLGGNQLMLRAMELVRHVSSPEVLDELLEAVRAFSEAQLLANELLDEGVPTVALWEEHADGHTGALFAFCCRAGALVSGCEDRQVTALGRYGRHLGRMWHIAEDLVLLQGEDGADKLLKRALAGRPIFLVTQALELDPSLAGPWRALVDDPREDRAEELLERMRDLRAGQATREVMVREGWAALAALQSLDDGAYRTALERLASGLMRAPYDTLTVVTP
jgi:geranylgeranyl pyrophosphate synthase